MSLPVLRIDFVSDIACPWCAIGLASLKQAIQNLSDEVRVELHFQPFELNPEMGPEGEDTTARLKRKYQLSDEQLEANRANIRERAAELGLVIELGNGARSWNTFDAHRLLHWAGTLAPDKVLTLKQDLFRACFARHENISDPEVLSRIAARAGLDENAARALLASEDYADQVRALEASYQRAGIHSVPSIIINGEHLIQGGQPVETFEQALRELAGETTDTERRLH